MEATDIENEGLEAVAEGVLPFEMGEGLLGGHGCGLYVTVGAYVIEDGMEVLFLHRSEGRHIHTGCLEEVDELESSCFTIHTDAGANEGSDVTAIEFVPLLGEVHFLVLLACAELLPEDLLQFTDIRFGKRVEVLNLEENIVILAVLGKIVHDALLIGDAYVERCCHTSIGDDIDDVDFEGSTLDADEVLHE